MATVTLQRGLSTVLDTYLDNNDTSTNYGSASPLQVGTALEGKNSAVCRALLRFDLSSIPAGATVNSATLTLVNTGGGVIVLTNSFRAMKITQASWTESGATWNQYDGVNNWATPGGDIGTNLATVSLANATANLTFSISGANIAAAIVAGNQFHVIVKRTSEPGTQDFGAFYGSEDGTPANRPSLVVAYTPLSSFAPVPFSGGFQDLVGNLF